MIRALIRQYRAVNICFALVFILGFLSLSKLGREELPEFGGEGLNIQAVLPGASPDEMDLKVARLLNQAIVDLAGVDEVTSSSRQGFVSLSVSLKRDELDTDGLRREIAQIVSQVPDLPADLEGPYVSRQLDRLFPPVTLLFKGGDELERHKAWLQVKQRLMGVAAIDAIEVLGDRDRRIEIRANPLVLEKAGLRLDTFAAQVQNSITDVGAGMLDSRLASSRVRTAQQPTDVATLENIMLPSLLGILPVSHFAQVVETLAPEKIRVTHDGETGWYVNLFRRKGSNVSALSTAVTRLVTDLNAQYTQSGEPFRIVILYDRSRIVTNSLSQLSHSIFLGMVIVFIILWIFLGTRNAIYAAIGIPFSFFAAFIAMDLLGLSINILTLFGLVLVSGMVVDDAIVVLENIDRKRQPGRLPLDVISEGIKEVAPAVFAATGTTIAVFLPLMLMSGNMGMYISQIPKVAVLALVASLVECFIILPIHLYSTPGDSGQNPVSGPSRRRSWRTRLRLGMERVAELFSAFSAKLVLRPYQALGGFFCLFLLTTAVAYLRMDFKLFDASETRSVKFYIEFDRTVDLKSNDIIVRSAIDKLDGFEDSIREVVLLSGYKNHNYQSTVREHVSSIELPLTERAIEAGIAVRLADQLEEIFAALPGVMRIQRSLETNSPPTGIPVQIYLYGEDANSLRVTSRRVRRALQSVASIRHVSDPMADGISERLFKTDSKKLGFYGLDSDLVADLLRASLTGLKVGKVDRGSEVVDVYVTTDVDQQPFQVIMGAKGGVIPMHEIGAFVDQLSADTVHRFQGRRFVSITAEVDESIMSVYATHREIEKLIDDSILSSGVTFDQQGEYSDTQQSLASMIQAALIGLGLSYVILTLLFRSFLQPVIVLMVIPLAYMGVVWGMTLTAQPLTLMGFVGVVGLIGIVINDALVWVSFYNHLKQQGIKSTQAAAGTVKQRFRPIWLTTITTVGGLLPVSLSQSAGIANAMASTMVYGLMSAALLLLLFLPVCVVVLDDLVSRMKRLQETFFNHRSFYHESFYHEKKAPTDT